METTFENLRASVVEVDDGEYRLGRSDRIDGESPRVSAILSGPHQLPSEILSEIFIECLLPYSTAPISTRAPMLLAAICRDWREIALSTPRLWSRFILTVDLVKMKDGCAIIQLFETWISRGGNSPLTMVINSASGFQGDYTLPASFISVLNRSSSRWHDVNLVLPLTDFYRLQANEGLPLLRRLAIRAAVDNRSDESPLPPLNLFNDAPMLHDVSLGDGFTLSNITLPLHQLTYFDSRASPLVENDRRATTAHYLDVFRKAPNLAEVRIDLRAIDTVETSSPVQSNVKLLIVQCQTRDNTILNILDCVSFPELETFGISGHAPILSLPLLRFLSRSSPPLRELFLDVPAYHSDALTETVPCLIALPTLVRLEIKPLAGDTAHDIFNRISDPTALFLPRLQTLRVQVNMGLVPRLSWKYDTLARMLAARWNRQTDDVEQLQVFAFSFSVPFGTAADPFAQPDPATLSQLEILAEQGMDIEVVTESEVPAISLDFSTAV